MKGTLTALIVSVDNRWQSIMCILRNIVPGLIAAKVSTLELLQKSTLSRTRLTS
jgi:hypothetical protein